MSSPTMVRRSAQLAIAALLLGAAGQFVVQVPAQASEQPTGASSMIVFATKDITVQGTGAQGVGWQGLDWRDGHLHAVDVPYQPSYSPAGPVTIDTWPAGASTGAASSITVPSAWRPGSVATSADGSLFISNSFGDRDVHDGVGHLTASGSAVTPAQVPTDRFAADTGETGPGLVLSADGNKVYQGGRSRHDTVTLGEIDAFPVPLPTDQSSPTVVAGGFGCDDSFQPPYVAVPIAKACLYGPAGLARTGHTLYVVDQPLYGTAFIDAINLDAGTVTTVAGTASSSSAYLSGSAADDGLNALDTDLGVVAAIAVDRKGDVFLGTRNFNYVSAIHEVTADGTIHYLAGGGTKVPGPGVSASDAVFDQISGATVDHSGDLFMSTADWDTSTSSSNDTHQILEFPGVAAAYTKPGAPEDLHATAGDGTATLTFKAPADDGGDPVMSYLVTAHPNGASGTGSDRTQTVASSPVPFTGLTDGTTYTLSVRAHSGLGDSISASTSITPQAPDAILTADITAGIAPMTTHLDASGSHRPAGTTFQFYCGDTGSPTGAASTVTTATCHYDTASPDAGYPAYVVMHVPVDGRDYQDTVVVHVAPPSPSAVLTADVDHGTAPFTVPLDASGSKHVPPGATFAFYCGDSDQPVAPAGMGTTATCTYRRASPAAGWSAYVVMRDPATGHTYQDTVPITVAPAPGTVEDSAAFPASAAANVPVAGDGSLTSDSCGSGKSGVTCVLVDGTQVILAAGPGTFTADTTVHDFVGDNATLQSELGPGVQVQGGMAVTWTPRAILSQPLVVTVPKAHTDGVRHTGMAPAFDFGGFLAGIGQAIADGTTRVVQTIGAGIAAAANAVSSWWAAAPQAVTKPNGTSTNDVLTCASISRSGNTTTCNGPYTWQKDVPTQSIFALDAGSRVIAAGGGNVIAAGGGNILVHGNAVIAAGGGNVIAAGGGNVIAAGGGNFGMTITGDPGFGFVTPADPTPPTADATLEPPLPSSGVYPAGTTVTVHLHASSPADPAIELKNVNYAVEGAETTAYTIVAGDSADVSISAPGASTVTYGAQDADLNDAAGGTQVIRIARSQTISFTAPVGVTYGDGDTALGATATSELPVSYTSSTPPVCTIVEGKVHAVASGACTITASQGGDDEDEPAADVTRTFQVAKAALTVTAPDAVMTAGDTPPAVAPSYAGFVNDDDASVLTTVPTCTADVATDQTSCSGGSDDDYSFSYVDGALTVNPVEQHITLSVPDVVSYAESRVPITAGSDAGLPVDLAAGPARVCSVAGAALSIHHAGACTITGSQAGDAAHRESSATLKVSVHQAPLLVRAAGAVARRHGKLPRVAPRFTGFVRGDTVASLSRRPRCRAARRHQPHTVCAGAKDPDYRIRYHAGRLSFSHTGYGFGSVSRAYVAVGHRLKLAVKVLRPHHARVRVKEIRKLPVGLRLRHNRAWTKVVVTGRPRAAGSYGLKLSAEHGSHVVARQKLVIEVDSSG